MKYLHIFTLSSSTLPQCDGLVSLLVLSHMSRTVCFLSLCGKEQEETVDFKGISFVMLILGWSIILCVLGV